jgi:hypothetical protein
LYTDLRLGIAACGRFESSSIPAPQIGLRMLLVWMAVLAIVFPISAKWPIDEPYLISYEAPGADGTYRSEPNFSGRPPKLSEFLVRVGISLAFLALALPIT